MSLFINEMYAEKRRQDEIIFAELQRQNEEKRQLFVKHEEEIKALKLALETGSERKPSAEPETEPEPETEQPTQQPLPTQEQPTSQQQQTQQPEKFLAVLHSCNKHFPIVYDIFYGKDDMNAFVKQKKLKYFNNLHNDDEDMDEDMDEENEDLDTIGIKHNKKQIYLEIRRYHITNKACFRDKNDHCVTEHLTNGECKPEIMIIRMEHYNVREIMRECIGDFAYFN